MNKINICIEFSYINSIEKLKQKVRNIVNDTNGLELSSKPYSTPTIMFNEDSIHIDFIINVYDDKTHTLFNIRQIFTNEFIHNDDKYTVNELNIKNAYLE